ncbi:Protoheme IX farnesyltransferase [Caldithrix abyssi DSM 13497]|uniref:Protoheme IX farnesyltransferase n=2 Tax=Caldithrix abyssi DSM 13497 TaxID=880073 RepID=H1XPN8_CALAY|nr:Protoheme IX farnesyltransferase [Caldithrix abyssi DSM 13497]
MFLLSVLGIWKVYMIEKIKQYFTLSKPEIMLLVIITGATSLVLEGSLLREPLRFLLALVALYLTGGSANALNQYFERERDALMKRTAGRRPLPQKKISHKGALIFSLLMGISGVLIFGFFFNWYSALLSLVTLLFYSFFYTLYLKPTTPQNIVIGGAAGAMAPVGVWVAATGSMSWEPWILFLIIFLWTPPHFWALALFYTDDYRASKLPMMPVIHGERSTLNQIVFYTLILVAASLTLVFSQKVGWVYGAAAAILGFRFIRQSFKARASQTEKDYRRLFFMSIQYLFILFVVIVVEIFI